MLLVALRMPKLRMSTKSKVAARFNVKQFKVAARFNVKQLLGSNLRTLCK